MTSANGDPDTPQENEPASERDTDAVSPGASREGDATASEPKRTAAKATQYSSQGRAQKRIKGIAESAVSQQARAYNSVFEAVGAIVISALIGWFSDDYFDTKPRYLIIGILVGFAAFVLRLVRMAREFQETFDAESAPPPAEDADEDPEDWEDR